MRGIFCAFLFTALAAVVSAQDIIIKKNGEEITAKVMEIGTSEIKYKKPGNAEGPLYAIPRSDVFMIKYADGSKDVINDMNAPKEKGETRVFKSYVAINVGVGIPAGTFGSSNPDDSKSGYGMTGMDFGMSASLPLASFLRVGFKAGRNSNPFDKSNFTAGITSENGLSFYFSDIKPISRIYFLTGPSALIPGEKISLEIRAMAGISLSKYPGYTVEGNYYYANIYFTNSFESAGSTSFVYDVGLGLLYSFNERWIGMLNLDYISSNDEFTHTGRLSYSQNGYNYLNQITSTSARRPISAASVTLGAGYTIGK